MLITDCIPEVPPHAFTIGTFDGVHLGHQAIFQQLKATGKPTAVLTFAAHPLKTLKPGQEPPLITPLPLKLTLLKEQGLCLAITIPFSPKFASLTYQQLLRNLPLSHLILGEGASFGQGRDGTQENVSAWGKEHHIPVEYIAKTLPASSQKIRDAILLGDLSLAESLLGRPHLLYVPAHTTRFSVAGLAMPPDGNYLFSLRTPSSKGNPAKSRSGPKIVGTIRSGWAHFTTAFSEPTILLFNPRESHVI